MYLNLLIKVCDSIQHFQNEKGTFVFDEEQSDESVDSLSSFFTTSTNSLDIFPNNDGKDVDTEVIIKKVKTHFKDDLEVSSTTVLATELKDKSGIESDTHEHIHQFSRKEDASIHEMNLQSSRNNSMNSNEITKKHYDYVFESVSTVKTLDDTDKNNQIESYSKEKTSQVVQPLTPPSSPGKAVEPLSVSISVSTIPITAPPSTCYIPILKSPNINFLSRTPILPPNSATCKHNRASVQGKLICILIKTVFC